MKRAIIPILAMSCLLFLKAAVAAPPEISNVFPDYSGNHLRTNVPHTITGENFGPGLEVYTWVLQPEASVVEKAAALLGTDREPVPPAVPPTGEEGRKVQGDRWVKAGYPNWDIISRWRGPVPHMGVYVFDVEPQVTVINLASLRTDMQTSLVWLKNKDGFSKPYLINTAQPKWMSEPVLQQGEMLRIYGLGINLMRNDVRLAFRRGNDVRVVKYVPPMFNLDGDDTRLLEMPVPADLEPGDYVVYVHNGFGGQYGWAKAGPLKVEARRKAADKVFRARDFGALGDGEANDTAAIRKVLEAARAAGGGKVYFAPGTYMVDESITVPSGVKLSGGGKENTIIEGYGFDPNVAPADGRRIWSSDKPRPCSVLLLQPYTGLERLLVRGQTALGTAGQTVQAVQGGPDTPPLPRGAVFGRIRLQNMQVDGDFGCAPSYTPRRIAYGVEVRDSVFYGSFGFSSLMIRGDYSNNRIHGGSISGWGYYDSLIERNIMDQGPDRFSFIFPVHNTYVRYNEIYNFGTQGIGVFGAAEAYLLHAGSNKYIGRATAAGPNTLTDSRRAWSAGELSQGTLWHMSGASTIIITAGRGFGQYRKIVANGEDTLTVDRPWLVVPDATSEYVIGNFYVDSAWYANYLDGIGKFLVDCEQINTVVERQRSRLAGSIAMSSYDRPGSREPIRPTWYTMVLNSELDGARIDLMSYEAAQIPTQGPLLFANYISGNNLLRPVNREPTRMNRPRGGIAVSETYEGSDSGRTPRGRVRNTVISGNTITDVDVGICVDSWARKTFIVGNSFIGVDRPILDIGSGSVAVANVNSALSGETAKAADTAIPDYTRPDPLGAIQLPQPQYAYPEVKAVRPARYVQAEYLRNMIPLYTYIPANVESPKVQQECADNLKKLYGILQAYEKKNGTLPKAAFYSEKPLVEADSLSLLLGKEARPFLRCPAAGPDFDALGWPGYIWNDELSGRKLADIKDRKGTWLLMDFSAPHAWLVGAKHAGHRGGVNVLFADGSVRWTGSEELGKRWPFN